MFNSEGMFHCYGNSRSIDSNDAIPPRYLDARGGIDLEQVLRDQLQARRQVVQSMVRRLKQLWRAG